MPSGGPVDQSARHCTPPSCVVHARIYKRVPMTTVCAPTVFSLPIPFLRFPRHHTSVVAQIQTMADLTWNAVTAVGAMEYPEAVYVSSMDRIPPTTTLPHGFNVSATPPS